MSEIRTTYTLQKGSSETFQVGDQDKYYILAVAWGESRILNTSIEGMHDTRDAASAQAAQLNNPLAFSIIERQPDESRRSFVIRTWSNTHSPGLSGDDLGAIPSEQQSAVVVQDGYRSPYRFGRVLRAMVGDRNAEIFGAHKDDGAMVYYAWNDGPSLAAIFDPAKRAEPAHADDVAPDWFDAVDKLGA